RSGVRIIDARSGKSATTIEVEMPRGAAFALTSDAKSVAAQPAKNAKHAPVKVWDAKTGKEVASLPGRGASCQGLTFGPGGKRLLLRSIVPSEVTEDAIGFGSGCKVALACIDVGTRKIVGEAEVGDGQFVALCPDGETVAIDDRDSVRVRHLPSAAERSIAVR